MVERVTAFQALDGSLHRTWEEAASVQGAAIFASFLPDTLEGDRTAIGQELARHFFVDRNEAMLTAFVQLQDLMMSAPRESTHGIAERFAASNITPIGERRGWFK